MKNYSTLLSLLISAFFITSCSKPGPPPADPCAGKTITITGTTTPVTTVGGSNGSITATASGSTGFTFSINNGVFQASGTFSGLAVGNYTITAKDGSGCTATKSFTINAPNCPTVTLAFATTPTDKCSNNTGSITVTATGSTGFTYSLNGGAFQASNVFNSLPSIANATISVKDANGCTTTGATSVAVAPAGAKFTAVKNLLATHCATVGCHAGATPQNGLNFADDCTIVSQAVRIKIRAVDANPSVMPPTGALSAADKQKITDWINAGGKYTTN